MTSDNRAAQGQPHGHASSSGGGFLSKLRGQAEAALSRVPAYNEVQHIMRQQAVTADPRISPNIQKIQLLVKGAKGVIIDEEALARESKSFSKNILDLGRQESPVSSADVADLQDNMDRLAFLIYTTGELHAEYAKKLEASRTTLKDIRNHENSLTQHRARKAQIEKELAKLSANTKPDNHTQSKIADLRDDLDEIAGPNSPLTAAEISALTLRRQKMSQAFSAQFDALAELGEKLAIVAGHGKVLVEGWNVSDKAGKSDYVDGARTAAVRSSVETALNAWSPSKAYISKPNIKTGSTGTAPSFHDSHATQLASIPSETDPFADHQQAMDSYYQQPETPPATSGAAHGSYSDNASIASGNTGHVAAPVAIASGSGSAATVPSTHSGSPFVQQLNTSPVTSLPGVSAPEVPARTASASSGGLNVSPDGVHDSATIPGTGAAAAPSLHSTGSGHGLPTVAETGAPITGTGGPSSGVLRPPSGAGASAGTLSKEEEARADTNRRFEQYSQGQQADQNTGAADLDRHISISGRNDRGEQLPAYAGASDGTPAPPEKLA